MRMLIVLLLLALPLSLAAADKVVLTNGETLVGTFKKFEGGKLHFSSESAGDVEIAAEQIASLELEDGVDIFVARSKDLTEQTKGTLTTKEGKLFLEEGGESSEIAFTDFISLTLEEHDSSPRWTANARFFFQYKDGNTETTTLGGRFDVYRNTANTEARVYGEIGYEDNRNLPENKVTDRYTLMGARYSYIFDFKLAVDAFTEWRFDEFKGYRHKAVFGLGASYYVRNEPDSSIKAWAALTYNIEDNIKGTDDRSYFGARIGVDTNDYFLDRKLHIETHTWLAFDFEETENMEVSTEVLADYAINGWLTTGVQIRFDWDNVPSLGFERGDLLFRWTVGITWGGRWV